MSWMRGWRMFGGLVAGYRGLGVVCRHRHRHEARGTQRVLFYRRSFRAWVRRPSYAYRHVSWCHDLGLHTLTPTIVHILHIRSIQRHFPLLSCSHMVAVVMDASCRVHCLPTWPVFYGSDVYGSTTSTSTKPLTLAASTSTTPPRFHTCSPRQTFAGACS